MIPDPQISLPLGSQFTFRGSFSVLTGYFLVALLVRRVTFYQPSSVRGWTSAFLLTVYRFCGVIEGD